MTDRASEPIVLPVAPKKRRLMNVLKLALLLLVLALVGRVLFKQWQQIAASGIDVRVRPWPLVGTVLMLMGVAVVQAVSYRAMLGAYVTPPPWRQMWAVAWVPPMGKYVPGKVVALLAAMAMLRRYGIPAAVAVSVVLVLDGLANCAGLIVSAPLLWWPPVAGRLPWGKYVAIPLIAAAVVCLWPPVFSAVLNRVLRLLKRAPLPHTPTAGQYALPLACGFGQWVLHGAGLALIVQSVTGLSPWSHFPLMMGFAALSQTLGYLALFAPGGLGVREAVLLACLTPLVGPLAAVIVPIRAVAQVIVDLTMGAIGLCCARTRSGASTS